MKKRRFTYSAAVCVRAVKEGKTLAETRNRQPFERGSLHSVAAVAVVPNIVRGIEGTLFSMVFVRGTNRKPKRMASGENRPDKVERDDDDCLPSHSSKDFTAQVKGKNTCSKR